MATESLARLYGKDAAGLAGSNISGLLDPADYGRIRMGVRKRADSGGWTFQLSRPGEGPARFAGRMNVKKISGTGPESSLYLYTALRDDSGSDDDRVRDAVYEIAGAADKAATMEDLYMSLHRIISTVMPAGNFYLSLYDPREDLLSFPYFVDEVDEPSPTQKPGRGLTEYVLRTGTSLLCTLDVHDALVAKGEADLVGAPSAIWLGVPLIVDGETIGAMVVQHYSDPDAYGENEKRILEFMSSQIANVIQRKRAESALKLSNERYQRFVARSFEGIWMAEFHNPVPTGLPAAEQENLFFSNGVFVECNDMMGRMLGHGRGSEVVGRKLEHLILPTIPENRALIRRFISSGYTLTEAEVHRTGPDGSESFFLLNLIGIVRNDALAELWGIQRDVTERRRAEMLVRESEKKYRSIFEGSQDAIFVSSADGTLLDVNQAAVELLGYPSSTDVVALPGMAALFTRPGQLGEYHERLRKEGRVRDFEVELTRRDGQKRVVLLSASSESDASGNVTNYRGFIRDITDRRRLEEQFRQAQKMEGIGTLAGGIAHDFNNLLGIILGFTQLMESGKGDPERFAKSIETIKKAVERGSGLVRQLLTFARRADPSFHDLNANDLVNDLVRMLTETFPRTITIATDLDAHLPMITADHGQLQQALLNLCVNARDAITAPGRGEAGVGTLTLSTRNVDGATLREKFTDAKLERYVGISVRDSGMGMDEETRSRIFEPFFTTKELGQGTGLGLSVVYGILNSHQGFIDVESRPGEGTAFHLYFPITDALYPPEPREQIPEGIETILIVEDEEMLRDLLKTFLTGNGYTVLTAQNGEEGLEIFRERGREISLVLSDMGLPRLGGWEMFQQMKEIDDGVKVILASGYFDPNLKMDLVKAGAKDFIQKPYVPDYILRRIREVIDAG
jgi:two-component system cell cycle sensor histidine kinase/response regulator CckA